MRARTSVLRGPRCGVGSKSGRCAGGSEREAPTPCENNRRNPSDSEPKGRDNHEHGNKHMQA